MSLKVNNKDVQKIYFGDKEVSEVYKGNQLVYQGKLKYYCYTSGRQWFYFTELVTEIKGYELYHTGGYGERKADSVSEVSLQGTIQPDRIIQNGFSSHIFNWVDYYRSPENDLYK